VGQRLSLKEKGPTGRIVNFCHVRAFVSEKNNVELNNAVRELYYWQYDYDPSRFSCKLFDLIAKADPMNRERIRRGFPAHVLAYDLWNESGNYGDGLFKSFGIPSKE
jgi:hypothetical protein